MTQPMTTQQSFDNHADHVLIRFKDLQFEHIQRYDLIDPNTPTNGARIDLPNDLHLSVITGPTHYSDPHRTYEVAMFHHDDMLRLSPHDEVLGWQTPEEIDTLLVQAQTDPNFIQKHQPTDT